MFPTDAVPVFKPMPMSSSGRPAVCHSSRSSATRCIMASAVRQALTAWSPSSKGAPQKAITASPIYLSSVPFEWNMRRVISDRYPFSRSARSCASSSSDIAVKLRISLNITVISVLRGCTNCGRSSRRRMTSGLRYFWKLPRTLRFYRVVVEEREKRKVRGSFQQYLSPEVIRRLLERPQLVQPRKTEITVMFSDIRNFTAISEELDAQDLALLLN